MQTITIGTRAQTSKLQRQAMALAIITVIYNVVEGLISVYFGIQDEALALFGFGLDSFVEVISGLGIMHMLWRSSRHQGTETPDSFESTALRITGGAFYLLAAGLIATAVLSVIQGHAPETTFWGIVISGVSIMIMWALIVQKLRVGRALGSDAIIADAHCTRACMYLSVILMASSLGYELLGIGWLDSAGAIGIAWLAWREGREAFEKAKGGKCSCAGACS